jgi:hypothetical protein
MSPTRRRYEVCVRQHTQAEIDVKVTASSAEEARRLALQAARRALDGGTWYYVRGFPRFECMEVDEE